MLLIPVTTIENRMGITFDDPAKTVLEDIISGAVMAQVCGLMHVDSFEAAEGVSALFLNSQTSAIGPSPIGPRLFLPHVNLSNISVGGVSDPDDDPDPLDFIAGPELAGDVIITEDTTYRYISATYNHGYATDADDVAENLPLQVQELAVLSTLYTGYFQGAIVRDDEKSREREVKVMENAILHSRLRVPQGKLRALMFG